MAVVRAHVAPDDAGAMAFLPVLAARLDLLQRVAGSGEPYREPARWARTARRFLRPRIGSWHDGDENLVRGWLDTWRPAPRAAETAASLIEAAGRLSALRARAETVWFFLWEMESLLAGLRGDPEGAIGREAG